METASRRELTIGVSRQDEFALFFVADSGTGIAPEMRGNCFNPS